ncbi:MULTISPECIES: hypothetical protein [unclassified Empedobacter]|uniref:hypothetical protein n=1 Tax=unclassified Empedobacter TaxID=2643773 RepID=UPI0025C46892|nr:MULTISPECIES: hypothetical protein [unclassified Empedobacter]
MGVVKITHLISLQHFIQLHINDFGYYELKGRYELFLNKEVKKGMFIPCDEFDNPIGKNVADNNYQGVLLYQKAKEHVLFEGWTYDLEDEYLVFKIGETDEWLLDFEEIQDWTLRDLILEELKLSQTALNEIYNII